MQTETDPSAPAAAPATPAPTEPTATAPAAAPATPASTEPAAAAPEAYVLEAPKDLPEGVEVDTARLAQLNEFVKARAIPKEAAEELLGMYVKSIADQRAALAETSNRWKEEVLADPVLGKPEAVAAVRKVIETFGEPDLVSLLNETGLANHPAAVRTFHKIAKALSEDAFIPSGDRGAASTARRDPAAVLYGASTH